MPPLATVLEHVHELVVGEHPVLEQVTDPAGPVGEQFAGVKLLDVLRQHQDRQPRYLPPGRQRRAQPLVGEGRREPDIDDRDIRALADQRSQQCGPIADRGHDVTSVRLEQPCDALPQEEQVFGDDNAHGTSITTMVGPPAGLLTARMPSNVATRRSTPSSPVPLAGSAPP